MTERITRVGVVAKHGLLAASEHLARLAAWLDARQVAVVFETATAALMTVADLSTVWVTASVPEKDTSLISVLGVTAKTLDLARFGRNGVNDTANATPLVVAGLVYLALTVPLTQLAAWMERRSKAGRR